MDLRFKNKNKNKHLYIFYFKYQNLVSIIQGDPKFFTRIQKFIFILTIFLLKETNFLLFLSQ